MRILTDNFALTELETLEQPRFYIASDELTQTLSRLMAFDRVSGLWRMVECDARGRLILSDAIGAATSYIAVTVTISPTPSLLLPTQTNRTRLTLSNTGSGVIRLAPSIAALSSGFLLQSGMTLDFLSVAAVYVESDIIGTLSYIAYYA